MSVTKGVWVEGGIRVEKYCVTRDGINERSLGYCRKIERWMDTLDIHIEKFHPKMIVFTKKVTLVQKPGNACPK